MINNKSFDDKLKTSIKVWFNYGQEECSFKDFLNIQSKSGLLEDKDIFLSWFELKKRDWLIRGTHREKRRYALSPDAVQFFYKENNKRLSFEEAKNSLKVFQGKINIWNRFAEVNHYPSIAISILWGSLSQDIRDKKNITNKTYGDLDIVLVWRNKDKQFNFNTPVKSSPNIPSYYMNKLISRLNKWNIEETVEEWLCSDTYINISNTDQWNDFFKDKRSQQNFNPFIVSKDNDWLSKNDIGDGVSSCEKQDVEKFVFHKIKEQVNDQIHAKKTASKISC